ncbi:hypothetical protein AB0M46_07255 [Dactylosporangium sp. NPDC051485]|uniref:hypothetical protein n=1 Tax=Dactylosporangium sp. NPDC051485 TaxID=3154846 RepID=UPI003443B9D0
MHWVNLAIAPGLEARLRSLTSARAVELLRRTAVDGDQLEHISARAGPDRLHVGLFFRTPSGNARDFCRRALATQPELAGWHVVD